MFLDEEFLEFEDTLLSEDSITEWLEFYFKGYSKDVDKRLKENLRKRITTKEEANELLEDANRVIASTTMDLVSYDHKIYFDDRAKQELITDIIVILGLSPVGYLIKGLNKYFNRDLKKARARSRKLALTAKKQIEEIKKENGWS